MTVREDALAILERANEVLDERGWCQHQTMNARGQVCAVGAIQEASRFWGRALPRRSDLAPYLEAVLLLGAAIGIHMGDVPIWNDMPGRSEEDVHLAFKQAIRMAEELVAA